MNANFNDQSDKKSEGEAVRTVEDLYALYFPNAYDRKLEEKVFESYSKPSRQPAVASIL